MKKFIFLLIFGLAISFISPYQSFGFLLKLHPEVGVNRPFIKVKDIGSIIRDREDVFNPYLEELILMKTPEKKTVFSNAEIQKMISRKIGKSILIKGKSIVVNPMFTLILAQEVTEKIKTQVSLIYPEIPREFVEVVYIKPLKLPKILASNFSLRVIIPKGSIGPIKWVRIEASGNNEILLSESVSVKLLFRIKLLVAKQNIYKQTKLMRSHFNIVSKNIFTDPRSYVFSKELPRNIRLKRFLKKGQVLLKSNIY